MAGYGSVRAIAEQLAETDAVRLLQQTLDEEKRADMRRTEIGERANMEAEDAGYVDDPTLMGKGKVIRRQRVPQETGRVKADKQPSSGGGRSANGEQRSPSIEGGSGDASKGSD